MPPASQSIFDVIQAARGGAFRTIHVLVGEETLLIERAVTALRRASVGDGIPGFNDDVFDGRSTDMNLAVSAARTLPMMSDHRFVLIRSAEHIPAAGQEILSKYLENPSESACLVIAGEKLDGRGKLKKSAKAAGVLTETPKMKEPALRDFARSEAEARGHTIAPDAAHALVDAIGTDLSGVDDAIERLSLFVGPGQRIDRAAVETCVTRASSETIWTLVKAIGQRDAGVALGAASSLIDQREAELKILAMIARELRIIAKMRQGLADGLPNPEAAKNAGAPPFKANELRQAARRFNRSQLRHAFDVIARTDALLKGGSRRPPATILQEAILLLCAPAARSA